MSASLEDLLVQAIAGQFFQPVPMGTNNEGQMTFVQAPATAVALTIYHERREQIIEAVAANLDVDDLAARIAKQVLADLSKGSLNSWDFRHRTPDFVKRIDDAVIDKIAEAKAAEVRQAMEAARHVATNDA